MYNKLSIAAGVASAVVVVTQLLINRIVDYPPTAEQLNLLFENIWLGRILGLTVVIGTLLLSAKQLKVRNGQLFILLGLISPAISGLWLFHFKALLNITGAVLIIYWLGNIKWRWVGIIVAVVGLQIITEQQSPRIWQQISIRRAAVEINNRFLAEDQLPDKVNIPRVVRRLAYNKYSLVLRNVLAEFNSFWNLEKIFFQELSPNSEKGLVVFYWILIIPFGYGLYMVIRNKQEFYGKWLLTGIIFFLASNRNDIYRFGPTLLLVLAVIIRGMENKKIFWPVMVMVIWGWAINSYDFFKRPDFWLDNRPIVYKIIFQNLKGNEGENFQISDRVGNAQWYCRYFLKDECDGRFIFDSFEKDNLKPGIVYAGFIGEFLGKDMNNKIDVKNLDKLEVYFRKEIRDSVAWGYGNTILIGKLK